jgi:hypothetical protein
MVGTLALCPPSTKFRIFLFKQKWRIQFDVVPASPSPRTLAVTPRACGVSSTPRLLDSIISVSGILDRPVKPGDDGWIQLRVPANLRRAPFFSLSARCPSACSHRERQQRVGAEFLTSDKPLLRNRRRAVRDLVRHRLDLGDHKFGRRVLHHVTDARQHDQPCVRHRGGERAGMNIGRHGFVDVA